MRQVVDSVFKGLFLILLGIVFFLNTYGILPWDFWVNVIDLWPLLLIVAGIALFFNRRVPFSAVLVVFLLALVGYSYFNGGIHYYGNRAPIIEGTNGSMDLLVPSETGIKKSELDLNLGGSHVNLSGIKTDSSQNSLLMGTYQWTNRFNYGKPEFSHQRNGDTARIKFNSEKHPGAGNSNLDLKLSDQVEYDLDINAGAVSGTLDFSQLRIKNFDMNSGASDIELRFGDTGVYTKADLSAGASKVTLVVPENVGLKIHMSGITSGTNFAGDGLFLNNKEWISSNYDSANTKIEMNISVAAGKVNLERQGTTTVTH
jgi:hypothetical protein